MPRPVIQRPLAPTPGQNTAATVIRKVVVLHVPLLRSASRPRNEQRRLCQRLPGRGIPNDFSQAGGPTLGPRMPTPSLAEGHVGGSERHSFRMVVGRSVSPPMDSGELAGHEDFQGSGLACVGEYFVRLFHLVQVEVMGDEPVRVELVALE